MRVSKGDIFGTLLVLGRKEALRASGTKKLLCTCLCDCGNTSDIEVGNLTSGNTKKCNKCAILSRANHRKKHSFSVAEKGTIEYKMYNTWLAMKRRCNNKKTKDYPRYGGRGIKVCFEWDIDFNVFLNDIGLPPSMGHQIERVNNNKNYTKNNCVWATRKVQANNKRNNKVITAFGLSLNQQQWADNTGIKRETIAKRLDRGWDSERAVTR
jgi:hypothetical protein